MIFPGETEAGNAGMQPRRGIAWWSQRDDERRCEDYLLALPEASIGSVDQCLENPRPQGGILTNGERPLSISG
jgi:hypothetical protein